MSSLLTDLLAAFPNARVTVSSGSTRRKPRAGDRRFTKKHGWQVRRQQIARRHNGEVIGARVQRGRPVWEWVSCPEPLSSQ